MKNYLDSIVTDDNTDNNRDWISEVVSRYCTDKIARQKNLRWPFSLFVRHSDRRVYWNCLTRRVCLKANIGSISPSSPWIKGKMMKDQK